MTLKQPLTAATAVRRTAEARPKPSAQSLGAMIASAGLSIDRRPRIPLGTHLLEVISGLVPEQSVNPVTGSPEALVVEFKVLESTNLEATEGDTCAEYFRLSGGTSQYALSAQWKALNRFMVTLIGAADAEQADEMLQANDLSPYAEWIDEWWTPPGPAVGWRIRCVCTDTGKVTQDRPDGKGGVRAGGTPIYDRRWASAEEGA